MKKKALIPVAVIVIAAGTWFVLKDRGNDLGSGLILQGNVDIRSADLGFRVGGRVDQLLLDEGDEVVTGQVMARLDPEPMAQAVADAAARVEALRAQLAMLEAGYRKEEIDQARATVDARRVALANANRQLDRETELKKTGAAPVKGYDDALAARDEAVAQLKLAEASLALLMAGYRSEQIAQSRGNLAAGEAALDAARLRLADTVLEAPSDGVVLTRAVENGMIVNPGATVYALSLTRPVWVRAYVGEPDLGRIRPGQRVEVFTDTYPDRPYAGRIGFISPTAEFTPKTVETRDLRTSLVYRLRVVVNEPDDGLRQGMPVTVVVDQSDSSRED